MTKYWSMHNEFNKVEQEHFHLWSFESLCLEQEEIFFPFLAFLFKKFRHFWRQKIHPKKSLRSVLHQAIQLSQHTKILVCSKFIEKQKCFLEVWHYLKIWSNLHIRITYQGSKNTWIPPCLLGKWPSNFGCLRGTSLLAWVFKLINNSWTQEWKSNDRRVLM